MARIDILKKLNEALNRDSTLKSFDEFDQSISKLKENLKKEVNLATLDDVKLELAKFQKLIDFNPIMGAVDNLGIEFKEKQGQLSDHVGYWLNEITRLLEEKSNQGNERSNFLDQQIFALKNEINSSFDAKAQEILALKEEILNGSKNSDISLSSLKSEFVKGIESLDREIIVIKNDNFKNEITKRISALEDENQKTRKDLLNKINNSGRGGSMNRNIAVDGNTSVLSKYTDVNLKSGTNTTITYASNDTTKYTDITFNSTGGSGSGLNKETPTGTVDDSNTTFTVTHTPFFINVNGGIYEAGDGVFTSYAGGTITLNGPVGVGGFIKSYYSS